MLKLAIKREKKKKVTYEVENNFKTGPGGVNGGKVKGSRTLRARR